METGALVFRTVRAALLSWCLFHAAGCTSRVVHHPPDASTLEDLHEPSRSRTLRIETENASWDASTLRVDVDRLHLNDGSTEERRSVPLQDVRRLSVQNRNRGATVGALWGLALGLVLGAPVIAATQTSGDYDSGGGGAGTVAIALGSGLLGAIWGGYNWGWTHYEFDGFQVGGVRHDPP